MHYLTTVKITTFFTTSKTYGEESPETVYDDSEFGQPLPKDYPIPAGGIHTHPTNVQIKKYLNSKGMNIIKPTSMKNPEFDKFVKGTKQPFGASSPSKMFFDDLTIEKPFHHYDIFDKKSFIYDMKPLKSGVGSKKWDWLRRSVHEFTWGDVYESFTNIGVEYGHNKEQFSWPRRLPKDHDYQIITYSFIDKNDYSEEHIDRIEYIQERDGLQDHIKFHFFDEARANKNSSKKPFETKHNWQTAIMHIDSWEISVEPFVKSSPPEPKTKPKEEPKTKLKEEPKTKPKAEPKTKPKAEPKTKPKAEAKTKPKVPDYKCGKLQVMKHDDKCPVDKKFSDRKEKPDCCYKTKLKSVKANNSIVVKETNVPKTVINKNKSINWKYTMEHVIESLYHKSAESSKQNKSTMLSPGSITLMNRIINKFGKIIVDQSIQLSNQSKVNNITSGTIVSAVEIVMENQQGFRKQTLQNIKKNSTSSLSNVTIPNVIQLLQKCSNGKFTSTDSPRTQKALVSLGILFEYFVAEILSMAGYNGWDESGETSQHFVAPSKILPRHIKKAIDDDEELKALVNV